MVFKQKKTRATLERNTGLYTKYNCMRLEVENDSCGDGTVLSSSSVNTPTDMDVTSVNRISIF